MRNLKRALSLALATVMTLGLMVVGTGAVGYDDVADTDNVEAIEVLQEVGIMTGVTDDEFDPDGLVTRNQMAVIMSQLLNLDYNYYRGTNPFTDVPSWAAPYVAACAAEGVVAGIGDGLYGGENQVTAAQAALMILKALGYFQYEADFEGDWQVATIRQASYIRLFDGIDASAEEALTRNQIAQLVLNGLKSSMVTFTGEVGITVNGVTLNHRTEYTARTSADAQYDAIVGGTSDIASTDQYIIQLGEELYDGDLRLQYTTDVFGRPARYWEYDGNEIGTYVRNELIREEYTVEVTGKDLYDLLGSATIRDYGLTVVIDGVSDKDINKAVFTDADMNRNNRDGVGATGNGVLTQVFVDNQSKEITISIINTYLAFADKDYDEKKEELDITAYGLTKEKDEYVKVDTKDEDKVPFTLESEDFDIADYVSGDALLVTVAEGEVQTIADAEILSEVEISAFKVDSNITVDGTKYSYASSAEYKFGDLDVYTTSTPGGTINLKDLTYNVYLDRYGYAIGVEEVNPADNYLFITGIDTNNSNLGNKTADANVIFLDGTTDVVEVNLAKSDLNVKTNPALQNTWCTYTVNSSGVYTVSEIDGLIKDGAKVAQTQQTTDIPSTDTKALAIDKKNISLDAAQGDNYIVVYGNDKTVYLTVELAELVKNDGSKDVAYGIINDVSTVTTGIKNANLLVWNETEAMAQAEDDKTQVKIGANHTSEGVYTLYKSNGTVIAAIVVGEDAAATKNLVYVHSSDVDQEGYDRTTGEWTWTREVTFNGEETTLTEVSDSLTYLGKMEQYRWYQVKYDANGNVIAADLVDGTKTLTTGSDYVTDYELIDDTVKDGKDNVLYYSDPAINSKLKLIANTLFVANDATKGFYVSDDVKVVLQQWNKNKLDTFFEDGVDSLEDIIDDLNERYDGKDYTYRVSAILENGMATTVVIYDSNNDYQRPETETPAGVPDASVSTSTMTVTVPVTTETKTSVADLAIAALEKAGYTVDGVELKTPASAGTPAVYELTASKGKVSGYVFETVTEQYAELSVSLTGDWNKPDSSVKANKQYVTAGDDVKLTITYGGTWEDDTVRTATATVTSGGTMTTNTATTDGTPVNNTDDFTGMKIGTVTADKLILTISVS